MLYCLLAELPKQQPTTMYFLIWCCLPAQGANTETPWIISHTYKTIWMQLKGQFTPIHFCSVISYRLVWGKLMPAFSPRSWSVNHDLFTEHSPQYLLWAVSCRDYFLTLLHLHVVSLKVEGMRGSTIWDERTDVWDKDRSIEKTSLKQKSGCLQGEKNQSIFRRDNWVN